MAVPSPAPDLCTSDEENVSPYLRRRLRSYTQYLRDLARQKAKGEEPVAQTPDADPGSVNGGGNDDTD